MSSAVSVPQRVLPDQFDPDPALQTVLDRLTTYYPRAIDPNLERTFRLLHDLGDPHLSIPPAFHVAGTNGKGSTIAYLRAMLAAAGQTTHVMTSPHLVRFNERLIVSGREIETPALLALLENVEHINNGAETTSFELITAAGFLAFANAPADVSLIEVGMGGRFDATNVIPAPLASIITVISRDHVKFLGSTLDGIAREKAGIIKDGCPVIIGPQTSEGIAAGVMDVFAEIAAAHNAPLYRHGHEWSFDTLPYRFMLHTPSNMFDLPRPNLLGEHQIGNAATAAMALLTVLPALKKPVPMTAMEQGLTHAVWPGRLQPITQGPLAAALSPAWELWIDGGHNDTGGQVMAAQAKSWQESSGKPLHIILGMLNTKNPLEFVAPLAPYAASVTAITIPDQPLSLSAEELKGAIDSSGRQVNKADSVERAVQQIITENPAGGRILITGSLYLMGHILAAHS